MQALCQEVPIDMFIPPAGTPFKSLAGAAKNITKGVKAGKGRDQSTRHAKKHHNGKHTKKGCLLCSVCVCINDSILCSYYNSMRTLESLRAKTIPWPG